MTQTAHIENSQQPLDADLLERFRDVARAARLWDVVLRPKAANSFPSRITSAHRALKEIEEQIAEPDAETAGSAHRPTLSAPLLELRQSKRLLRMAIIAVSECLRGPIQLPRIVLPDQKQEPRVATLAGLYLRAADGVFSASTFRIFIHEVQAHEPLTLDELWKIPAFLNFTLLELLIADAQTLLHSPESEPSSLFSLRIKSLRSISNADWVSLIEPLIAFDATLRHDPAQAYASMDFESRELYRKRIAFIAYNSDCTESEVAQTALKLAREDNEHSDSNPRMLQRQTHVGYYLIDKGFPQLASRIGFHPPLIERLRTHIRDQADFFYITGIEVITILLIAALIMPSLSYGTLWACLAAALLLILPASQSAVDLVNNTVTAIFDPHTLPKLDFSKRIPLGSTTLVVVPTLLLNEDHIRRLVTDLEIRFLANRDPHLHFALLSDLPDSVTKPREKDSSPLVDLAIQLINELNIKYASPTRGSFLFLHRHRVFNHKEGVWMGWERKRGKLLDLNKLLAGEFDAFPIKGGNLQALSQVRYVLTLDADTQLSHGTAAKLIGAIAHPLNQAIVHPGLRIVTEGYGILQPRIGIAVQSASRSRLASIYSGQSGFDIYTRAVSDAYQDLYSEGIFTGKGIYEAATLHATLAHRFPANALLSHDLIEGAYARAGLATDIELIDDYPSHLSAYNRRKHRWVRGDWQISPWMFSHVRNEAGRRVRNPISDISRWKIFDNLRRSLVEPFTFVLLVAGWLGLPGGPLYWTAVSLLLLLLPTLVQAGFGLFRALTSSRKGGMGQVLAGFWQSLLINLLNLVYLPHQTLLALDAIVRALVRQFITGERLLEWETAAQAETHGSRRIPIDRYLVLTPFVAIGLGVLIDLLHPHGDAIEIALPILVLWGSATVVTVWLNAAPRDEQTRLSVGDEGFLIDQALRIWRYFHQFGAERHNYLIPDNVEEDGLVEAARVSPTNLGLLLNARQAACEFGFLTAPEFATLTHQSLLTIVRLEKHRGHLMNWYDTQTLEPLNAAPFVSSVDSGNFVASLYTLHAGAYDLVRKPLLPRQLFGGLRAYWRLMRSQGELPAPLAKASLPGVAAPLDQWYEWLVNARTTLASAVAKDNDPWWLAETQHRVGAILALFTDYMPWLCPEYQLLRESSQLPLMQDGNSLSIEGALVFSEKLEAKLAHAVSTFLSGSLQLAAAEKLHAELPTAKQKLRALVGGLRSIAERAEHLAEQTDFSFLVNTDRQLLSIGYDVKGHELHEACYDMLASEARVATFLAVARGELSQEGWFKLARDYTFAFGQFVLLSWTGTMFEYLMPALWMRRYPDTLISSTIAAGVSVQRAFARSLGIPWGISESGASRKDDAGHYHYQAYGIPQIAVFSEATAGPVVSPYSTFLALGLDSLAALHNLRSMASAGWIGAYGLYEAADYSVSRGKPVLVREWMAHHQGMSLLAILNLLHDNVVQQWFHASPMIQSVELLLHETAVHTGVLKAELKTLGDFKTG